MKKTFGNLVSELRKEKGFTQADLAEQMGVTDKAVSKWERDLSYPDISSIPKLAEVLEVPLEQLMKVEKGSGKAGESFKEIFRLACKAVGLAMGVAVTALSIINKIDSKSAFIMLGVGLFAIGIYLMSDKDKE